MSKREILVLTSAYEAREGAMHNFILELLEVPEKELSPREQNIINRMHEFGELYAMTVTEHGDHMTFGTDLNEYDQPISVTVPRGRNEREVAELVQTFAEAMSQLKWVKV